MIIIYLNKLYTTLYDIPKMMYKKENYDYHSPLLLSQSLLYHLYLSYNDVVEKKNRELGDRESNPDIRRDRTEY